MWWGSNSLFQACIPLIWTALQGNLQPRPPICLSLGPRTCLTPQFQGALLLPLLLVHLMVLRIPTTNVKSYFRSGPGPYDHSHKMGGDLKCIGYILDNASGRWKTPPGQTHRLLGCAGPFQTPAHTSLLPYTPNTRHVPNVGTAYIIPAVGFQ